MYNVAPCVSCVPAALLVFPGQARYSPLTLTAARRSGGWHGTKLLISLDNLSRGRILTGGLILLLPLFAAAVTVDHARIAALAVPDEPVIAAAPPPPEPFRYPARPVSPTPALQVAVAAIESVPVPVPVPVPPPAAPAVQPEPAGEVVSVGPAVVADLFMPAAAVSAAAPADDPAETASTTPAPDPVPAPASCRAEVESILASGPVTFTLQSARLTAQGKTAVTAIARALAACPKQRIEVAGFTDNTGGTAYNRRLSTARAREVARLLVDAGVKAARVSVRGYGEDVPRASNASQQGRTLNRRIEFTFLPAGKG